MVSVRPGGLIAPSSSPDHVCSLMLVIFGPLHGGGVIKVILQVLASDIDLLHPPAELEKQKHKLKRLVQSPNSFFMDVKCAGCFQM